MAHNKCYYVIIISSSSSNEHRFIVLLQFDMCVYSIYIEMYICMCVMDCKGACISSCAFQLKCLKATNLGELFY